MIALALGLLVHASQDSASTVEGFRDLQPTTYRSPSGEWELHVDPRSPDGAGEGHYRLSRGGEVLWTQEHPLTYWRAILTDDGYAAGFGYSEGVGTWSGRLVTWVLSPDGNLRRVDSKLRGPSRFPDYVAVPSGLDLFEHPHLGAIIVIVGDRETALRGQEWRLYDVVQGKRIGRMRPKEFQQTPGDLGQFLGGRPVAGAPLFLVHWAGKLPQDPVRFSLINEDGRPVWTLDRPDDLVDLEAAAARIGGSGLLLPEEEPGVFAIWFRREGERARYLVEQSGGEWSLHELEREAFEAPEPPEVEALVELELLDAPRLGSIDLSVQEQALPAVHNVGPFAIDGEGRLAFLPAVREGEAHLTLVDTYGELVERFALDAGVSGTGDWVDVSWDDAGRFLLVRHVDEGGEIWTLDPKTGELARAPIKVWWATSAAAALPDGGIVIQRGRSVLAHDAKGEQRWAAQGKGMAVLSDGQVAVLDPGRTSVRIFDIDGHRVGSLDLSTVWSGKPDESTRLEPDTDGGFLLVESSKRIVRMKLDGSVRGVFTPLYENGLALRVRKGVNIGPLGRLWVADRSTLLRLNPDGVVDRRLGLGRGSQTGDSEAVGVGPNGRIYAAARGSETVRVFDVSGDLIFTCDPGLHESVTDPSLQDSAISAADDGHILFSGRTGVFLFSPNGRLVDTEERIFDPIRETWYSLPALGERLVVGQRRAYLVDARGEVRRTLERTPGGRWLKHLYQAAVAPDGSFALLTGLSPGGREQVLPGIHLFDADGEPLRTIWVPVETETLPYLAYDGELVIYVDECVAYLFREDGRSVGRIELPGQPGLDSWQPLRPPGTDELWVFDLRHTIERYSLP